MQWSPRHAPAPTWQSIDQNYGQPPAWLREAKFGIWVHFGPQAAGESGDWYARNMYMQGSHQYEIHLKKYGHPTKFGFKDVIPTWKAASSWSSVIANFCGVMAPLPGIRRAS